MDESSSGIKMFSQTDGGGGGGGGGGLEQPNGEAAAQDMEAPNVVEERHFMEALSKLTPSVSLEELKRYKQLEASYRAQKTRD
jgi:SpoVK/Ycf46/Vps4 family AAA+-type ATPase